MTQPGGGIITPHGQRSTLSVSVWQMFGSGMGASFVGVVIDACTASAILARILHHLTASVKVCRMENIVIM
ncbi:hypothetical protein A2215_03125 [Candidatus Berkelbacteria bacterium RIFOXYA2_FULL_43_10]|uniref:Uncharacterized protein n=1 Tax=Candidatus Berkelbacteria bacterium RIFOXYA2_FULL_43_10 TaxID=1797472 RepID=A0A1F5E552_9BACT|nr:MAG: hypothetical protein A2215_03125 [Candidatus Berkelbacteria bacterium RIFOXYA2_FULL_43_10]